MSAPTLADVLLAELEGNPVALDALADRLAPLITTRLARVHETSPWLNAEDAATYMACPKGRLYDLVQIGKLEPRRDGRRLLFRRSDLDNYLENGE